jgi:CDP-diacylglycerol---glycerol-3-phosphate 3-phosphatidyltransferase
MTSHRSKLWFVTFLTFVRFPLVMLFFVCAVLESKSPHNAFFFPAFAALVLSTGTDFLDGFFARKFQVVTRFGAHADPLMDKMFYLTTLPLLVYVSAQNRHQPHALILLILTVLFLSRDQWVTFLRSIGSMYNVSGGANWSGKLRTGINFPLVCVIYYYEAAPQSMRFFDIDIVFVYAFEALALLVNMASLYIYTRRYWPYIRRSIQS